VNTETIHFHQCLNPRCPCNYYPSEVSSACPVCGVGGAVAGFAFKDLDAEREADAKAGDDIPFT
jgi:hypothetical protein